MSNDHLDNQILAMINGVEVRPDKTYSEAEVLRMAGLK